MDRWFATPDIRIHGLAWGGEEGAPVVLMLHGVTGNAFAWARGEDAEATWTPVRIRSFLFGFTRDANGGLIGKLPTPVVERLREARTGGEDVTAALNDLATPTLLLVATRRPPARMAHKLAYAERLPDVTTIHRDGSHFLHTDVPDRVAWAIAAFADSPIR